MIAEFGAATLGDAVEAMLDAAERHARAIVASWADGVYDGEAVLDDDGFDRTNIVIRARVTKQGSDVTVDLSGSDPQVTGFINSSFANTQSAVAMAFAFLLDPDITKNEGAFRPLTVVLKEGTIVWAREGAPVTMCTSHCSNEIIEAIIVALAPACPERAMGGWGRRLRIALNGVDPRNGRRFIWHMFQARPGGGGSAAGDGFSTIGEWHSAGGIKFGIDRGGGGTAFRWCSKRMNIGPGSAGDGKVSRRLRRRHAACGWRPTGRRWPTPPARASCTAPAACWAATTARRTTTRCCRPARRRAS